MYLVRRFIYNCVLSIWACPAALVTLQVLIPIKVCSLKEENTILKMAYDWNFYS